MRIVLLLSLLLLVVWKADGFIEQKINQHLDTIIADYNDSQTSSKRLKQAKSSIVYVLATETWTDFPLLPNTKLLKILSNVALAPEILNQAEQRPIHYRVQYQVINAQGDLLLEKDYHHRSRLSIGSQYYLFYLTENEYLTQGRFLLINLQQFSPKQLLGATLRLRYQSANLHTQNVVARVYSQEKADHAKLYYLWQRLSEKQRTLLADKTLYPADLLYEQEKQHLLRQHWTVLGPAGIFEQNYFTRHLYQLKTATVDKPTDVIPPPTGLYVDSNHHVTFNLAQAQSLQLQTDDINNQLSVQHYHQGKITTYHSEKNKLYQMFDAGLLDIQSQNPSQLTITTQTPDGLIDSTPILPKSKTFSVTQGQTLRYTLSHNSHQPQATPIRFVTRLLLDKTQPSPDNCSLTYQLLNEQQKILRQQTVKLLPLLSHYDRTIGKRWETHTLSQVQRYYLIAQPKTATLQFTANCPTLVSVYNRPARLSQLYIHNNTTLQTAQPLPNWFRLNPDNGSDLYLQQRQLMIAVQTPPPNYGATSTNKKWQTFTPNFAPPARYLLTKREDNEQNIEPQQLGVYYRRFRANKTYKIKLSGTKPLLKPQLIFQRYNKKLQPLTVFLNGQSVLKQDLYTRQGQLQLPQMPAGLYSLRFNLSGNSDFYLNQIQPSITTDNYIKRLVYPLLSRGLRFNYHKADTQAVILSARLYLPQPQTKPFRLKVSIQATDTSDQHRIY